MTISRIIVGSSNVRRFYSVSKFNDFQPYKVEFCTVVRMFEVTMDTIVDDSRVIVSVVENFIEKAITTAKDEGQRKKALEGILQAFMKTVVETSKRCKKSKFAIAYPITRPANGWMTDNEDLIRKEFEKAFNGQCQSNISKIDCVAKASQVFAEDGVHLTEEAGTNFVGNLIGMAEDSFEAEVVDLEESDVAEKILSLGDKTKDATGSVSINELKRSSTEMRQWRDRLERNLDVKFRNDNLMFARMRDEMDAEVNRKKEDRTLVSGFVDPSLMPASGKEKIDFLKKIALEFCNSIMGEFDGQVLFATAMGRPDKGNLMLEFKLDSAEKARELRKSFALKRVGGILPKEMEKLQVMSVVTQGTRVRTEILRAIARHVDSATEMGYVPTYLPRPILHIKAKEQGSSSGPTFGPRKHIKTLTFTDAIAQYGRALDDRDLSFAYEKAAWNFQGQMRQNFVVLRDHEEKGHTGSYRGAGRGGGGAPRGKRGARGSSYTTPRGGTKRNFEGEDTSSSSKFKKH